MLFDCAAVHLNAPVVMAWADVFPVDHAGAVVWVSVRLLAPMLFTLPLSGYHALSGIIHLPYANTKSSALVVVLNCSVHLLLTSKVVAWSWPAVA